MAPLETSRREERVDDDVVDVPAAVVCAFCGEAECSGCQDEATRSGIVTVVAWERSGLPLFARLWATARAASRDAESFFETLPDGPILPAFMFAFTAELLAAGAMLALFVPVAALVAPGWLAHLAFDSASRSMAVRAIVLGVPAFATLLVVAHVAHGLSIDIGARKQGALGARGRALRFGLYACGWDLVIGPLGAIVMGLKEGGSAALGVASLGSGMPTRATRAFLRGTYHLVGEPAKRALGTSYVGAVVATIFGVVAILGALVAALLA